MHLYVLHTETASQTCVSFSEHFSFSSLLLFGSRADPLSYFFLCVYVCVCRPLVFPAFDCGFLLRISEDGRRAEALNEYLSSRSYLAGYGPSQADADAFVLFRGSPPPSQHVHALRWYRHIATLQPRTDGQASDTSE